MIELTLFQLVMHNDTLPATAPGDVDCDGDRVIWFAAPSEQDLRDWCGEHQPDLIFPPELVDTTPEFITLDHQEVDAPGMDIIINEHDIQGLAIKVGTIKV